MLETTIRELQKQVSQSRNARNNNYPWQQHRNCLHSGCRMLAEPGMVRGFAFCKLHMKRAQRLLGWSEEQFFEQPDEE